MTDKEKYDFIDHVVHLTLFEEDRLLNEHGGDYDGLEEDGIDSNEYYRIITERVIDTLKKNNNNMQEEPVSEDLEEANKELSEKERLHKAEDKSEQYRAFREQCGIKDPIMLNEIEEACYEGYLQAEKELALTWEDIKEICDITFEEACRLQRNMRGSLIYKKEHYQTVLKRFNEMKSHEKE